MTRWDALLAICGYLRAGLLGGPRVAPHDVPWEMIVEVASFHFVTPAIACGLPDDGSVPSDVREYFAAAERLNSERNTRLMAGLERAIAVMNGIDVTPMLLKGAALIADGVYPRAPLRVLSDVDLLVPAARATDVYKALLQHGLLPEVGGPKSDPEHHHLPMLHDPDTGLGIELHTRVTGNDPAGVLETDWFLTGAKSENFGQARILIAEPTRNAAHLIFHGQVFHHLDRDNRLQLRQLLDLALLRARYETQIDWVEIERRFEATGEAETVANYLLFAERLLDQSPPRLVHPPRTGAIEMLEANLSRDHFRARLERLEMEHDGMVRGLVATREYYEGQIQNLQQEIADLRASTSWRTTAPLRALASMLRRK